MDWDVQCGDCGTHFQLSPEGDVAGAACSECGGKRFFRNQPSPTQSDGTLRDMVDSDSQHDQGGNPLGEGTIMGTDGEKPRGFRDNYMHSKVSFTVYDEIAQLRQGLPEDVQHQIDQLLSDSPRSALAFLQQFKQPKVQDMKSPFWEALNPMQAHYVDQTVSKRLEMRTLDMEPYAPLWDESYTVKTAGPLAELVPALIGGASKILPFALPSLMKGALGQGGGQGQGQQAGGMSPEQPDPAPSLQQLASSDIPFLLLADYDTPHSVKSVDEQHDDPEQQDQKEFNDGDDSPSNLKNPNNEDSGADGEDGVRDATPGFGLGENSPSVERAMMILPLLLHYFQSDESGHADPLIRGLHDALEQESPGYLEHEHPEGQKYIQLIVQQHKSPHNAGVNAFPSGLSDTPTPGPGLSGPGGGICPSCGGTLAGDGSCPQCGAKQHPQGGAQIPTTPMGAPGGAMGASPGASYPPNRVGNSQGPVTQQQKDALHEAIDTRPELFGDVLNQIQKQPNSPPLVDPNQMTPPAPMPGMMNPSGGMPVNDPTQAGGGMPMQPMARTADANNAVARCPECGSATTTIEGLGDNTGEGTTAFAKCHSCGKTFDAKQSKIVLADLVNPVLQNAADQTDIHPEQGQDSSLTWKDASGGPLNVGQTYELHAPGYDVPDQVQVISKKPGELGLKLVGEFSNINTNPNTPDFTVTPQQMEVQKYTFQPSGQPTDQVDPKGLGGMPGMEHIPQTPETTDEASNSYPNPGTVSSVLVDDEPEHVDICHKCGGNWIDHIASSSTKTLHECARCGTAWETTDTWEGREASVDTSWILNDSRDDGFFDQMERARDMQEYGQGSRSLAAIAARDERLQVVRDRLEQNKSLREQHLAGRHFTPSEQRALINEKGTARNADLLDLENTHYITRYDASGKANPYNVPDSHLLLGL